MSDTARINTTQNVVIQYEVASVGERVLARLLDWVLFAGYYALAAFIVSRIISTMDDWEDRASAGEILYLLILIPIATYTLWCESFFNGKTFGKMILGLKVVKTDGSPAGVGDIAFRWILRVLEGEIAVFTALALPVAIISNRSQRIGDMVAGTIVIRVKVKNSIRNTILAQINPSYRVVFPQVAVLTDKDMNIIRRIMQQAYSTANYALMETLAHKVKQVMRVNPDPRQLPAPQFLNIVLADYAHYAFEGR
jgi:uncharacterized RDD family membrane protein YckC